MFPEKLNVKKTHYVLEEFLDLSLNNHLNIEMKFLKEYFLRNMKVFKVRKTSIETHFNFREEIDFLRSGVWLCSGKLQAIFN